MGGDAGVAGEVAEGAAAEGAREGEDFGGDDRELVGGVEGVGLGVGIVVHAVEAEVHEA